MNYDFKSDPRFGNIKPLKKRVWLASPTMHGEEKRFIHDAFESGWVTTAGENITAVETAVADYTGVKYAVALSSGTAALHLATKLVGEALYGQSISSRGTLAGHKVFCSDVTFDASVNPIAYENGEAVFIDTEYDTWNMDPVALERAFKIYPDVKLIVLAHLYGTPGKIEEIKRISDEHGALILEDAAESLGAKYKVSLDGPYREAISSVSSNNNPMDISKNSSIEALESNEIWFETGLLGSNSCISFNGNKIITGSSGGMFLTNSRFDADKVRKWSTQSREAAPWYQHEEIGYNYRMSNVIAGIIRGQIPYLEEHIHQKKDIYERYKKGLEDLPVKMNPYDKSKSNPNFWLSCIIIDSDAIAPQVRSERDYLWIHETGKSSPQEILDALAYYGCEGRPIWKPMHLQPIYRNNPFITCEGNGRGRSNAYIAGGVEGLDVGADIFKRGLCLPTDIKMSVDEQEFVIEIIHRCFR